MQKGKGVGHRRPGLPSDPNLSVNGKTPGRRVAGWPAGRANNRKRNSFGRANPLKTPISQAAGEPS
jgi:hypothetical protein